MDGVPTNLKYHKILKILSNLPFELNDQIWTVIVFENLELDQIIDIFGKSKDLDDLISRYLFSNVFVISRYMKDHTYLEITNVKGTIKIKSKEFDKLIYLMLNGFINIQNLSFQREIQVIKSLNSNLKTLIDLSDNLYFIYYDQLIEIQQENKELVKKLRFLSISSTDDITKLDLNVLINTIEHLVLNIYKYPIDNKTISNIFKFILKIKSLNRLNINIIVEKEMDLNDYIIQSLNKLSFIKDIKIEIKIFDNNLMVKNLKFDWLNFKLEPISCYINDLTMKLNSDAFIDFKPLKNYSTLKNLKISLDYSPYKSGILKLKNSKLERLSLYFFDKQFKISLKKLNNLKYLSLNSTEITSILIKSLPLSLKYLKLCDCSSNDESFELPISLETFKYEIQTLPHLNFPVFENLSSLNLLSNLTVIHALPIEEKFFKNLPKNLINFELESLNSEITIQDWLSKLNLSFLQNISNFKIVNSNNLANLSEYNLNHLPSNIKVLNLNMNNSLFNGKLPKTLEILNITISNINFQLVDSLNLLIPTCFNLETLYIKCNRLNYDLSNLNLRNLKTIKLFINSTLTGNLGNPNKSKISIQIGKIIENSKIAKFEIISNVKEIILIIPNNSDIGKLKNIGILSNVTELKKIGNLEMNVNKIKMDNVTGVMKNGNFKTKNKIKNFFR